MAFEGLSEKLQGVFKGLKGKGSLTEADINAAMREVKLALLEADVNFKVVREFVASVKEKALGEEVMASLTPGQQVIKIVNDELVSLMGGANSKLTYSPKGFTVYMMVGLQGTGKTTTCGKLAKYLKKEGKKPMLCACDIYRPAAIDQLEVVGKTVDVPVFTMRDCREPDRIATAAIEEADRLGCNVLIVDTAGILQIDEELMVELEVLKKAIRPHEILLVVDALTGQDAVNAAEGFNDRLAIVEAGFTNVVSIPGGAEADKWVDYNYDFLTDCKDIVLWFYNDQAGLDGRKKIANRLGEYRVRLVNPDDEIVKAVQNYYIPYGLDIDKTDANNVLLACGANTILSLIENAEIIENPRLKDLFSYTPVDIQTLPKVSTGFKALDKVVSGNFDNNLVILSGWSASGKSTMVAEMGIIAPLEAGKKIMVFSGEANGGVLLGTTYRPLAGRNHVLEWDNSAQGLPNGYSVTKEAMEFIKEYYKGKVYNYDDGDEILTTADEVLAQMEYAYKRYGVTHFTLDNLMCISCVSTEDDEKYESQYKFTLALKRFTRKYNVTVFLVAHAKKPVPGQKVVDMYSVSGASEIINLADRGFSISRLYDDPEGYNSCVYIMKDRVEGKAGTKVKLRYDRPTNRIYSDNDELFKPRQWEKDFKVNYPESIKSKIVGHRDLAVEAVANLF